MIDQVKNISREFELKKTSGNFFRNLSKIYKDGASTKRLFKKIDKVNNTKINNKGSLPNIFQKGKKYFYLIFIIYF